MRLDGYDAVGTGDLDVAQGEAYAAEARQVGVPLVRALPRGDALDALSQPLRLKRLQGHTLGVTALAPPPASVPWKGYLDQAAGTLRRMRRECDLLILLSQLGRARDEELARRCGGLGPHVIIGNLEAQALPAPLSVGGSVLLPTGPGGKSVGIAEVLFPEGEAPLLGRVSVVPARTGDPPDGQVVQIVRGYYRQESQRFFRTFDTRLLAAEMGEGAGDVVRCRRCHAGEAETWRATRHARAVDTLIRKGRLVPECLVCHSTRFRLAGIFDHAARAGDVDCTACHPPAPAGTPSRCPDGATRTRGVTTCLPCHTKEQSPGFRYDGYLPRVLHRGKECPKKKEATQPVRRLFRWPGALDRNRTYASGSGDPRSIH